MPIQIKSPVRSKVMPMMARVSQRFALVFAPEPREVEVRVLARKQGGGAQREVSRRTGNAFSSKRRSPISPTGYSVIGTKLRLPGRSR